MLMSFGSRWPRLSPRWRRWCRRSRSAGHDTTCALAAIQWLVCECPLQIAVIAFAEIQLEGDALRRILCASLAARLGFTKVVASCRTCICAQLAEGAAQPASRSARRGGRCAVLRGGVGAASTCVLIGACFGVRRSGSGPGARGASATSSSPTCARSCAPKKSSGTVAVEQSI